MSSVFGAQKDEEFAFPDPPFGSMNTSSSSKRLEVVERKVDQISETKVSDVLGGNNPPVFTCRGNTGFFTNVSFLYWRASDNGIQVASEIRFPVFTPSGNFYTNAIDDALHFDWRPGVRVGFGYHSGYDAWNVQGIYTWIRLKGHGDFGAKDYGIVAGPFGSIFVGILPEQAFTLNRALGTFKTLALHWSLSHNVGDLQFARDFYITKALAWQPLLGVRFASLDQSLNAHFGENLVNTLSRYIAYHIANRFWGLGPRIGMDGKWTLPHNVGFTGLIAGCLLYGQTTVHQHLYGTLPTTFAPFEEIGFEKSSKYMLAPSVQLALGLDWGMYLNKEKMYLGLNLGWEFNYWWNQFHFDFNRQSQAAIEMQGITLRSDLHF